MRIGPCAGFEQLRAVETESPQPVTAQVRDRDIAHQLNAGQVARVERHGLAEMEQRVCLSLS